MSAPEVKVDEVRWREWQARGLAEDRKFSGRVLVAFVLLAVTLIAASVSAGMYFGI